MCLRYFLLGENKRFATIDRWIALEQFNELGPKAALYTASLIKHYYDLTHPQFGWLSFLEGNPGIPGDGIFISAAGGNYDFTFSLMNPFSLGGLTDGFTITLFPPSDIMQEPQWIDVDIVANKSPYCRWYIWGALGTSHGTTVFNGVKGFFVSIPQESIVQHVTSANQYYPSCNFTAGDFYLSGVWFDGGTITTLDAAIILPGQNAVPSQGTIHWGEI